jgi:glycine/D-amino acid oxidase-like deaminating enzyme
MTSDVLVVGGGVVGCAIASACAKRGLGVTLVERGRIAGAASSLDLALLGLPARPGLAEMASTGESAYLDLHHFTGRAFLLDRTPLESDGGTGASVRRIDVPGATLALAEEARSHRAQVQTGCDVKGLVVRGGGVQGVRTDAGELRAGTTVVAAGAETWRVCRDLPVHVPLTDVEGVCAVYPPGKVALDRPLLGDDAWAATDGAGRTVVAEPERLVPRKGALLGRQPIERRVLRYAMTDDGLPLQGPLPGIQGLVVACGHGLLGVALAPAAGIAIAEALTGASWDDALTPDRFL